MIKNVIVLLFFLLNVHFMNAQNIENLYAIKNKKTGLLLRPIDASKDNEAKIVTYYPQNWKCMTWEFDPINESSKPINLYSGKTLANNNGMVVQTEINYGTDLFFEKVQDNVYRISNGKNQFLTAKVTVNQQVSFEDPDNSDFQLWVLEKKNKIPQI